MPDPWTRGQLLAAWATYQRREGKVGRIFPEGYDRPNERLIGDTDDRQAALYVASVPGYGAAYPLLLWRHHLCLPIGSWDPRLYMARMRRTLVHDWDEATALAGLREEGSGQSAACTLLRYYSNLDVKLALVPFIPEPRRPDLGTIDAGRAAVAGALNASAGRWQGKKPRAW